MLRRFCPSATCTLTVSGHGGIRKGRLCWGVDDFDEAYPLAYTNDLIRLAASVKIAIDAEGLSIKLKDGCNAILEGYADSLRQGGFPIFLAERDQKLGKLGDDSFKPPSNFWDKLNRLPGIRQPLTKDLKRALEKTLPEPGIEYKVVRRQAGLGRPGPGTIRGDCQLARRLHRTRSKVDGSIRLFMAQ